MRDIILYCTAYVQTKNYSFWSISFSAYLDEATDCTSSVSSQMDDSISDDIMDDVSVAVIVPPPPTKLVILKESNIKRSEHLKSQDYNNICLNASIVDMQCYSFSKNWQFCNQLTQREVGCLDLVEEVDADLVLVCGHRDHCCVGVELLQKQLNILKE